MSKPISTKTALFASMAAALPLVAWGQAPAAPPAGVVAQPASQATPAPEAPADPKAASYSLGLYFGDQLRESGIKDAVSFADLERGLKEGLAGKEASDADRQLMSQWLRSGRDAQSARNRSEAQEFLTANSRIAGVKTTASGLQYIEVKPGDAQAPSPKPTDRVTVQYRGHLLDGSIFDSSEQHGGAATFSLNGGVIPGWREALLMMKPGAEWRVFVPPDLGYGNASRPGIPPGSALVFDVQLVKVEAPRVLTPGKPVPGAIKPAAPAPSAAPAAPAAR